jgi:DNA modification methylase
LTAPFSLEVQGVLCGEKRWALIEGDCREVLPRLPAGAVDHCLADPPYRRDLYLGFRSNSRARTTNLSPTGKKLKTAAYLALASESIGAMEDVLPIVAPEMLRLTSRWIIVFHDAESGCCWREAFGAAYIRSGVWVKPNPVPQISGDRPAQGFEAATIAHRRGRKRWNGGGRAAVWVHNALQSNWGERRLNTHPCPKPLSLMMELVADFTDPDDVVLDPFAGSCSTGVACLRLGRRFVGIELSADYYRLGRERLLAEDHQQDLRSYRAGQLSLLETK